MSKSVSPFPILFTIPNFITAGSGRVMFNILTRLDRNRYTPYVCVSRKGGRIESELQELGIPVLELPFTVPVLPYLSFIKRAREAAEPFRRYHFKFWHSFHYLDDYSEAVIARLSGTRHWVYTKKAMSWGTRAWLLRSLLASRIVADNDEMPHLFFDRYGLRKKVHIIHHGLPLHQFSPSVPPSLNLRGSLNIPPAALLVACVAQLVPVKDHPTLLRAFAQVSEAHLLLAGTTIDLPYQQQLQSLCAELGIADRVHFLGSVSDIPALLAESDIFVLPTMGSGRMEGCPVALLEAMASGLPCIATDIPGSRDLIIPAESGVLVPPSNPEALASALVSLINSPDLRLKYAQNARRRVEENFSIEREVQLHEAMYAEMLGLHD